VCGRFSLSTPAEILAGLFQADVGALGELAPRYNIAPGTWVVTVRPAGPAGGREAALARWGLVPAWAKDSEIGSRMINARGETVAEKPAFRAAFRQRRCIVPADGFYEWRSEGGVKQPYHFRARDGRALGLAGLWERWRSAGGELLETCAIVTTEANEIVRPVHPRMPVVLSPSDYGAWLGAGGEGAPAPATLLVPCPAEQLVGYRVDRRVNSPRADDPALAEPID